MISRIKGESAFLDLGRAVPNTSQDRIGEERAAQGGSPAWGARVLQKQIELPEDVEQRFAEMPKCEPSWLNHD
jgi:hypothetical protein